jgi:hypothetical protein
MKRLLIPSIMSYGVSFFLPAIHIAGSGMCSGWEAARYAFTYSLSGVQQLFDKISTDMDLAVALCPIGALANILILLAYAGLAVRRIAGWPRGPWVLFTVAGLAAAMTIAVLVLLWVGSKSIGFENWDASWGYYLWVAAAVMLAVATWPRRPSGVGGYKR